MKVQKPTKHYNTEELRDQESKHGGTLNSPSIIMSNGGCKSPMGYHPNGQEWHPIIASHGEQKCIKCKCKVIFYSNIKFKIFLQFSKLMQLEKNKKKNS